MNVKTKGLQNGFHVSAWKERDDFFWDEGGVSSKMGMGAREEGRRGLAEVLSINHDPCYHELYYLSNDIIVLVFSELNSLVRKILQEEENKGVELTGGCGNGEEPGMGMRGGNAENLEKRWCRKKMGEKSKTARPDPVGACGTHSLPSD